MPDNQQNLKVVLKFEDQGATRNVETARKSFVSLGDSTEKVQKQLGLTLSKFASMGLTLGGIRQIVDTLRGAFNSISGPLDAAYTRLQELGRISKNLGIPAEKLRSLQFAFEEMDVSTEDLNQSLRLLQKNIGQAVLDPEGEANKAFANIALSVKDASGEVKSLDQVLLELANRFAKLPSDAERSATAFQLLGRGGDALVSALARGADEIAALSNRARVRVPDYGGSNTFEQISKIQDRLISLRLEWQLSIERILVDLAPTISDILLHVEGFVATLKENLPDIKAIVSDIWNMVKGVMNFFGGTGDKVGGHFTSIMDRISSYVTGEGSFSSSKESSIASSGGFFGKASFEGSEFWGMKVEEGGGAWDKLANAKQKNADIDPKLIADILKQIEAMREYEAAVDEYNKRLLESEDAYVGARAGLQAYMDQLGDIGDQMKRITQSVAQGMESAFTQFFFNVVMTQMRNLRDSLAQLAKALAGVFAQAGASLIAQQIMQALGGTLGLAGSLPKAPVYGGGGGSGGSGLIIPASPSSTYAQSTYAPGGDRRAPIINLIFPGVDAHSGASLLIKNRDVVKGIVVEALHTDGGFRSGMSLA